MQTTEKRMQPFSNRTRLTDVLLLPWWLGIITVASCNGISNSGRSATATEEKDSGALKTPAAANIPKDSIATVAPIVPPEAGVFGDTSVNDVTMSKPGAVWTKYGSLDSLTDWSGCECVWLFNEDQSQVLELHHANGGTKDEYDIFTVFYPSKQGMSHKGKVTNDTAFLTENEIQLGISEKEFLTKFPKISWEKKTVGKYQVYSFHNEYETYLAEYTFSNGRLIKYRFGYDNS